MDLVVNRMGHSEIENLNCLYAKYGMVKRIRYNSYKAWQRIWLTSVISIVWLRLFRSAICGSGVIPMPCIFTSFLTFWLLNLWWEKKGQFIFSVSLILLKRLIYLEHSKYRDKFMTQPNIWDGWKGGGKEGTGGGEDWWKRIVVTAVCTQSSRQYVLWEHKPCTLYMVMPPKMIR